MNAVARSIAALTALGLSGLLTGASAQTPPPPATTPVAAGPATPASTGPVMAKVLVNVSTLVGSKVKDSAGQEVGEITELMVDASSGQVMYAVLAAGGLLGMGKTLFAVPFDSLTISQDRQAIVLNARSEVLPRAPSFSAEKWPNMTDPSVQDRLQAYWQDASITAAVKWKLATDRIDSLQNIDVTTDQGTVALNGRVATET